MMTDPTSGASTPETGAPADDTGKGASEAPASLALYYYDGCPFCTLVQATIDQLAIVVEMRHIYQDRAHLDALVEARGRRTVPVLAITSQEGEIIWLGESRDIVAWLRARHAEGLLETAD